MTAWARAHLLRLGPAAAFLLALYGLGVLAIAAVIWDLSWALTGLAWLLVAAAIRSHRPSKDTP